MRGISQIHPNFRVKRISLAIGKHIVLTWITAPVLGILSELIVLCLLVDRLLHHLLLHGNTIILIIVFVIIVIILVIFLVIILVIIVVIVVWTRSRSRAWCGGWLGIGFWIGSRLLRVSLGVCIRTRCWSRRCWGGSRGRAGTSTTRWS